MLTLFPARHRAVSAGLLVMLTSVVTSVAIGDEPKADHSQDKAPKTLEQGLEHVRSVLEPYDTSQQIEWIRDGKQELSVRPDPDKPPVLIVLDGPTVIGHPMPMPESIAFDVTFIRAREVFDVTPEKRTLTKVQRSHGVSRIVLTTVGGLWRYEETILSNGVQSTIGKVASSGYVQWLPHGFELVGTSGVSMYYAAGGELVPRAASSRTTYVRDDDSLVVKQEIQVCEAARDKTGGILNFPDLTQPSGEVVKSELIYKRATQDTP